MGAVPVTHASWKQAIIISAGVALLAIVSVATIAWLRRPAITAPEGPPSRPPAPLLYHDPTGSVYDLHLKMTQLEERLLTSERHSRRLEEEMARLRSEREAGEKERVELAKRLKEMEREIVRLRRAAETTTATPPRNAPADGIEIVPQNDTEGGTSGAGTPTSP
jgi:hypothetical protein